MKNKFIAFAALALAAPFAIAADADVKITEIQYKGLFGEFVEITNTGSADVDLNGWKFNDSKRLTSAGRTLFSSSTLLGEDETVIITEVSAAVFTQAWYVDPDLGGAPATLLAIVENNSVNLGRGDEVNIYSDEIVSGSPVLIDRLTYIDTAEAAETPASEPLNTIGIRTEDVSGVPPLAEVGANNFSAWVESDENDTAGSWKSGAPSAPGTFGSPGVYDAP